MYLITLCKTAVNFYYGCEMKFLSLQIVDDDALVTLVVMVGLILNFLIRLSVGKLEEFFGFANLYVINLILNLLNSLLPLIIEQKLAKLVLLILLQRTSNGREYLIQKILKIFFKSLINYQLLYTYAFCMRKKNIDQKIFFQIN